MQVFGLGDFKCNALNAVDWGFRLLAFPDR
jgi:hypothetical protein